MASTNVEFYEKQKGLQDGINKCERERLQLDQQLRSYLHSDERMAKLKAVQLQNYWKKICADEKRSQQRNEQLVREFERIDGHLSTLDARLEKLHFLKRQYEEKIERQYPNWRAIAHGDQNPPDEENTANRSVPSPSANSAAQPHAVPSARSQSSPTLVSDFQREDINERQHNVPHQKSMLDRGEGASGDGKPPLPYYIRSSDVPLQENQPRKGLPSPNIFHHRSDSNGSLHAEDLLPLGASGHSSLTPQALQKQNDVYSSTTRGLSDNSQLIQPKVPASTASISPGKSLNTQKTETKSDTEKASDAKGKNAETDADWIRAELSIPGILHLLPDIEQRMVAGISCKHLYRSNHPDPVQRQTILDAANTQQELPPVDVNLVSMLLLEQLTLVVRTLPERCLLSESLLSSDLSSITEPGILKTLSPPAKQLWSALFHHFTLLLQFEAMEEQEVAAVFVPCLVLGSSGLDTAYDLMVHLLQAASLAQGQETYYRLRLLSTGKQGQVLPEDISAAPKDNTIASSWHVKKSQSSEDKVVESPAHTGHVPPLEFGSLIEQPFSDEESGSLLTSTPHESQVVPLNQTSVYRQFTDSLTQSFHKSEAEELTNDEDDDLEHQLTPAVPVQMPRNPSNPQASSPASQPAIIVPATSKHPHTISSPKPLSPTGSTAAPIYIPSAAAKFTLPSASTTISRYQGGIKISSDLDTDSDVDIMLGKEKTQPDSDIDFDFYD